MPLKIASRLQKSSTAYIKGIPTGHNASITIAIFCTELYSGPSQSRARSSCKKRRTANVASSYSKRSHKKLLNIRVAVLGSSRNVTTSHSERTRCSPARTAGLKWRVSDGRPSSSGCFRANSWPTRATADARRSTTGQQVPINKRLLYEPKHADGMMMSIPKSAGRSSRLIHTVYASNPLGGTTSNTAAGDEDDARTALTLTNYRSTGSKADNQDSAESGSSKACRITTIVAAHTQLVKPLRSGIAQLTSRPTVAGHAVATAIVHLHLGDATTARTPTIIRFAAQYLRCGARNSPESLLQLQRRKSCIEGAVGAGRASAAALAGRRDEAIQTVSSRCADIAARGACRARRERWAHHARLSHALAHPKRTAALRWLPSGHPHPSRRAFALLQRGRTA
eukprot:7382167-Prymnesium_polylepis.4